MEAKKPRYIHIETKDVEQRGGSFRVTIPAEVVKFLGIGARGKISFFKDTEQNAIILVNRDKVKLFIEGFGEGQIGFSVSEELMKKVLGKKE